MNARALGFLASLAVLAAAPAAAQNGYPEWNGNAVQDLAGVLSPRLEDSVRTLLAPARNRGIDVRVVTIDSMGRYATGASTLEDFGQGLFNTWHVGDDARNDGVLLVVSVGDRKVRIQLGDGALRYEPGARQVIADSMLPHFREGKTARAILRGTAGIALWFTPEGEAAYPPLPPPAPALAPSGPQPFAPPAGTAGEGLAAVFVIGFVGIGAVVIGAMATARRRPRPCPRCGTKMALLDESADDVYLDDGQRAEEFLASVDYDVWTCGSCGSHTLARFPVWFSAMSGCPSCSYRTVATSKHVLQYPTYDFEGREEVTRVCRHCNFSDRTVVTLPRRVRPREHDGSSSSGSFLSSSASYDSSSSSSSSSSGHSSGGGASGSW